MDRSDRLRRSFGSRDDERPSIDRDAKLRARDFTDHGLPELLLTLDDDAQEECDLSDPHAVAAPWTDTFSPESLVPADAILLTTDLSQESLRAFLPAAALAAATGRSIVLFHVLPDVPSSFPHDFVVPPVPIETGGMRRTEAEAELTELASRIGEGAQAVVTRGTDVASTIASFALRVRSHLIAIASHGRSGWRAHRLGGVADALLRRSRVPVYCVPRA